MARKSTIGSQPLSAPGGIPVAVVTTVRPKVKIPADSAGKSNAAGKKTKGAGKSASSPMKREKTTALAKGKKKSSVKAIDGIKPAAAANTAKKPMKPAKKSAAKDGQKKVSAAPPKATKGKGKKK
ncbi:MAG: hypothetical protein EA402_07920 [Planctomycetota bacterium]|nr:MAG: hypothetical protein EA402_07920 [Planctomycetota bacterium]